MNKDKIILTLGFLVIILPFLGFPGGVKTTLFVIFGFLIAGFAYLSIQERSRLQKEEASGDEVFEESDPENFQEVGSEIKDQDNQY